ncbi:hypothetical protein QBC39DRAFT_17449 [Podospora conica]|nr:hypothetical protein QBC39DRAFT_17449 [Schizothecium conicum]
MTKSLCNLDTLGPSQDEPRSTDLGLQGPRFESRRRSRHCHQLHRGHQYHSSPVVVSLPITTIDRLLAMPIWDTLLAPRGRNGLNGWLLQSPAAVSSDSSLPSFYPRAPPHTGARRVFVCRCMPILAFQTCRSQRKRGAWWESRPQVWPTAGEVVRLIDARELGRGGCPWVDAIGSAAAADRPSMAGFAGTSGRAGLELSSEADDLPAGCRWQLDDFSISHRDGLKGSKDSPANGD